MPGMLDLHCHLLPAIDDGATDLAMSLEMARMSVADGVHTLACTPHIYPGLYENTAGGIRSAITALQAVLDEEGIALKLVGFYLLGVVGIAAGASLHYLLMGSLLVRAGRRVPVTAAAAVPEPLVATSDPSSEGDFELPAVTPERPSSRQR